MSEHFIERMDRDQLAALHRRVCEDMRTLYEALNALRCAPGDAGARAALRLRLDNAHSLAASLRHELERRIVAAPVQTEAA